MMIIRIACWYPDQDWTFKVHPVLDPNFKGQGHIYVVSGPKIVTSISGTQGLYLYSRCLTDPELRRENVWLLYGRFTAGRPERWQKESETGSGMGSAR